MIIGNKKLHKYLEEGKIYCNPHQTGSNLSIDLHLGEDFWLLKRRGNFNIRLDDPKKIFTYYPCTAPYIVLTPHSLTLATTQEVLGSTVPNVMAILNTRSTLARYGITTNPNSFVFEPGFYSRWTIELINPTDSYISIPIGAHIGAAYFLEVDDTSDYVYTNSYMEHWTPETMLPKKGKI